MKQKKYGDYSLIPIQNKYPKGGYVLMTKNKGKRKVLAYGEDIGKLYKEIEKKKVQHGGKTIVGFIPARNKLCIFSLTHSS